MNAKRRSELKKLIKEIKSINNRLTLLQADEQMALDNTPESLQGSINYFLGEEAVDEMDDAINSLGESIEILKKVL